MRQQAVDAVLGRRELRVVEIVGVDRNAVGKSGEARVSFHGRSDDAGLACSVTPSDFTYCRTRGAMTDADPARARPKPSSIDFLPRAKNVFGNVLVVRVHDEFGDVLGQPRRLGKGINRLPRGGERFVPCCQRSHSE